MTAATVEVLLAAGTQRWQRARAVTGWVLLETLLPGATLFLLVATLSLAYLRRGLDNVRQHILAPDGGQWVANAQSRRDWRRCRCAGRLTCRCLQVLVNGMRQCFANVARSPAPG